MILDSNQHSVYLLYYHFMQKLCLKEQKKSYGITLVEWNHDIDHIHIMFKAQPKTELNKFINAYKSASSRLIKKRIS